MKSRALVLTLACMVLASTASAASYTVTQDSVVNIWSATVYGANLTLGLHQDFGADQYQAILDFGAITETNIGSATLQLTNYWDTVTFDLYLAPITEAWDEAYANNTARTVTEDWSSSAVPHNASQSILFEDVSVSGTGTAWPILDITSIVQWWAAGNPNYGIVLMEKSATYPAFRSKEFGSGSGPGAVLNVIELASVNLTVVNGTAAAGPYTTGDDVAITANAPATGLIFDQWTGDVANANGIVANLVAASTTIHLLADATVTATYGTGYTLTVINGTGGGQYVATRDIPIEADAPTTGDWEFAAWTGDITGIADATAASTTLPMPAANATVTATYAAIPSYTLTVLSGSGSGSYLKDTDAPIEADAAGTIGYGFDAWVGDVADVADTAAASTTAKVTGDATITATYALSPPGPNQIVDIGKDTYLAGYDDGRFYDNNYGGIATALPCRGGRYDSRLLLGGFDISRVGGVITSATLNMRNRWTEGVNVDATVYRVTQAWAEGTGTGTESGDGATWNTYDGVNSWATGGGDFANDGTAIDHSVTTTRGAYFALDVTAIVAYWQANPAENYGLIVVCNETQDGEDPNYTGYWFDINSREEVAGAYTAYLNINGENPATTYNLTVSGGSPAGPTAYSVGTPVAITADTPPAGQAFEAWLGDVATVLEPDEASTTITVLADATITATYDTGYDLTVTSGSGTGFYPAGRVVGIVADTPPTSGAFYAWEGDTTGIADTGASGTTITTQAADASITAIYGFDLDVVNGQGSGTYPQFAVVAIVGDIPPDDMMFDVWVGDTTDVADVNDRFTTVTMNASATVTATYVDDGLTTMVYLDVQADTEIKNMGEASDPNFPAVIDIDYRDSARGVYSSMLLAWGDTWTEWAVPVARVPFDSNDPADGKTHDRGIVEFDITSLTGAVGSAKLWLYVYSVNRDGNDTSLAIYRKTLVGAIDETLSGSATTWIKLTTGTPWATSGGDYGPTVDTIGETANGWMEIDVTELVNEGIAAGDTDLGLFITRGAMTPNLMLARTKEYGIGGLFGAQLWIDTAPPALYWPGDLNTDLSVDIVDLNMVLIDWGKTGGFTDPRSDPDGSGTVDIVDLNTVLIDWGKTGLQP